jgi:hypothetical protein
MKHLLPFMPIFAFLGAATDKPADVLPPRFNFDRYAEMVNHSPFAIATAVALPSATPGFAKDLYMANAARLPEGDMVTLASSSDQGFKKYLTTRQPVEGYSIASIEWSDRVGATKVTISKDGNFATITFNQALLSQSAPNAPPTPSLPIPELPPAFAQPPQPAAPLPTMQLPTPRQAPRRRVRGVIERNPNPKAVPMFPTPSP